MYRALKTSNKITAKRYQDRCQELHKEKLSKIKSSVDNKPPKRHNHLRKNLKREQLQEERFATIEHENKLLLQKMSRIMGDTTNKGVDMTNEAVKHAHSLNKLARKNELSKITMENAALLKRIQQRQPTYNHLRWEEERRKNEEYLRNICEFPEGLESIKRKGLRGSNSLDESSFYEDDANIKNKIGELDPEYQREAAERAAQGVDNNMGIKEGTKKRKLKPL